MWSMVVGFSHYIGSGGIGALQSFIVVTAAPVSLILLPTLWLAPRLVKNMARDQGIVKEN